MRQLMICRKRREWRAEIDSLRQMKQRPPIAGVHTWSGMDGDQMVVGSDTLSQLRLNVGLDYLCDACCLDERGVAVVYCESCVSVQCMLSESVLPGLVP